MELKPTIGIQDIEFGMTKAEVGELLGLPHSSFQDDEEPEHLVHQYDKLKLRLTFFGEEGGKMGYIRCADPDLVLQGQKVIGRPIETVKSLYKTGTWEVEKHPYFEAHFNEENWLILHVEYGEVIDIELGVPFKSNDEYDWKR
ncbi:MAG: hypothetical protein KA408_14195 [Flavobacteriales bacterium]|nr:hypothetical protein [Flavobacteriales bacterium]